MSRKVAPERRLKPFANYLSFNPPALDMRAVGKWKKFASTDHGGDVPPETMEPLIGLFVHFFEGLYACPIAAESGRAVLGMNTEIEALPEFRIDLEEMCEQLTGSEMGSEDFDRIAASLLRCSAIISSLSGEARRREEKRQQLGGSP